MMPQIPSPEAATALPTLPGNIQCLVELLSAPPPVLIPIPLGSKRPRVKRWQHLTAAAMSDPDHLRALATHGNTGVLLGPASGHLVSIDFDDDQWVEPFLRLNPKLRESLRSKRQRGCNVWLRLTGDYPLSQRLKTWTGAVCGEWRAAGNQTLIRGQAGGIPYRLLQEAKPVTVAFHEIVWPEDLIPPSLAVESLRPPSGVTQRTELRNGVTEPPMSLVGMVVVVEQCIPTVPHDNDRQLFRLARAARSLEQTQGCELTPAEQDEVFRHWYDRTPRALLPDARDNYHAKFLRACRNARLGLDQDPVGEAWASAQKEPLPAEALRFATNQKLQLLVALCYQLQLLTPDSEFWLSCRDAGACLAIPYQDANRLLQALEGGKVIRTVTKGTTVRATRFRYRSLEAANG
jgi:hypothetical protein